MLIFFIHGVAVRDSKYADSLKVAIKEELTKRDQESVGATTPAHFRSSFWGNALSDLDKMWGWIDQDLRSVQHHSSEIDIKDCFRYREFRESFLSEFVGDMFTYLNEKRGREIRSLITQELNQFLDDNPQEIELHIITHSLGSVIFWDMLFSERFSDHDPAFDIRDRIQNLTSESKAKKVYLKVSVPASYEN